MTAQLSAYGRLVAEPTSRITKNDNQMVVARLAVSLPCHSAEEGQATFWLSVVAFGKQAEFLMRHEKGELISVAGTMQINQWQGKDGTPQTGYQIVADSVISARTVRPGGGKKATHSQNNERSQRPEDGENNSGSDAMRDWEVYEQGADGEAFDQRPPFDAT